MPARIFLLEDHPIMREGYRSLIAAEPDLEICGEASSAEAAMATLPTLDADLVVVDLSLPGTNGVEFIKRLLAILPDTQVLVATGHDEELYAERALNAGARGYLMKYRSANHFVEAIRAVLAGDYYLSEELRSRLIQDRLEGAERRGLPLTDREIEVFEHFGRGKSTREVAEDLGLSVKTIESHRANIKRKLDLGNTAEFLQRAVLWVESDLIST